MSSPIRPLNRSSSSQRSTPSRSLPNSTNKRRNGFHKSLRDSVSGDSPSRQLLEDFGKMLINDDRNFKRSLDEQTAVQQKLHIDALDRALAKHCEVRDSAERTRERIELEVLREKQRQAEEEKKAVEKARRELEEQERRRKLEEQRAQEEERKRQEALKREEEETRRKAEAQRQRESEEKARKDQQAKEDADRRARQDAEAKQKQQQAEQEKQKVAQQPAQPFPQLNGASASTPAASSSAQPTTSTQSSSALANLPPGLVSSPSECQAVHNKYLDLHKRLKEMRQHVLAEAKKVPGLKDQVSEWRRKIQKCCGQLVKGSGEASKTTNKSVMLEIMNILDAAAKVGTPSINITQYLVQNDQPAGATTHGPGILLFLLNQFAKKIISQFISESAVDPETADVIGILAVTIFARPNYHFNGQSLIDVLWAKYHKVCPVLFGIIGNDKTREGRIKLGWHVESGAFVRDQEHYNRNSGLGAGFAAMGLRDFSKSKNSNPVPNRIYWEALARILNTPKQYVQSTHCVVLKAMIQNSVPRILTFFGGAGLAVLRQALIFFPAEKGPVDESGKKVPAAVALQSMPSVLEREQHLTL